MDGITDALASAGNNDFDNSTLEGSVPDPPMSTDRQNGARNITLQQGDSSLTYANLPDMTDGDLLNSTLQNLKAIFETAPMEVRNEMGSPRTCRHSYIVALLRMRNELRQNGNNTTENQEALKRTLSLSPEELDELCGGDLSELSQLLRKSIRADSTLLPRQFDSMNAMEMKMLVYRWQATLRKLALEKRRGIDNSDAVGSDRVLEGRRRGLHTTNRPSANPFPSNSGRTPQSQSQIIDGDFNDVGPRNLIDRRVRFQPDTHIDFAHERSKRMKPSAVPPITVNIDDDDLETDFRPRLGTTRLPVSSQLGRDPAWKEEAEPIVSEYIGPAILKGFAKEGVSIEQAVRNRPWRSDRNGNPYPAQEEALTLARGIHMNLLAYRFMGEALENCPWLEVFLRRLWALLEVERLTTGSNPVSREAAREAVIPMLEVYPHPQGEFDQVREIMNRSLSSRSRAQNAMRNLDKKTKRQNSNQKGKTPNLE